MNDGRIDPQDDALNCPDCQALRSGLTWVGDPPRCPKHRVKRPTVFRG